MGPELLWSEPRLLPGRAADTLLPAAAQMGTEGFPRGRWGHALRCESRGPRAAQSACEWTDAVPTTQVRQEPTAWARQLAAAPQSRGSGDGGGKTWVKVPLMPDKCLQPQCPRRKELVPPARPL